MVGGDPKPAPGALPGAGAEACGVAGAVRALVGQLGGVGEGLVGLCPPDLASPALPSLIYHDHLPRPPVSVSGWHHLLPAAHRPVRLLPTAECE